MKPNKKQFDKINQPETSITTRLIIHGANNQVCINSLDIANEFGRGFESFGASGYCSPACRSYGGYQKRRAVLEPRQCPTCDAEFVPKRADTVYCSGKCRTASHRRGKS